MARGRRRRMAADPAAIQRLPERAVVAVFDLDGTLTRGDTLLPFLLFACGAGGSWRACRARCRGCWARRCAWFRATARRTACCAPSSAAGRAKTSSGGRKRSRASGCRSCCGRRPRSGWPGTARAGTARAAHRLARALRRALGARQRLRRCPGHPAGLGRARPACRHRGRELPRRGESPPAAAALRRARQDEPARLRRQRGRPRVPRALRRGALPPLPGRAGAERRTRLHPADAPAPVAEERASCSSA